MKDDLIERISALAGQDVAKAIQKEFGDTAPYIPIGLEKQRPARGRKYRPSEGFQAIKDALDSLVDLYSNDVRLKGRIEVLVRRLESLERKVLWGIARPSDAELKTLAGAAA